ncbi:MAG: hypothetical protein AAF988_03190 [Pseudomonadota bacterium]
MADAAEKLEFEGGSFVPPYEAKSRFAAQDVVMSGEAITASAEHIAPANVNAGVSRFNSANPDFDLELIGHPSEILPQAIAALNKAGVQAQIAQALLNDLQDYVLSLGSDFSRAAQTKPLYIRLKVTDRMPEDLPDCSQSQATLLDGMRDYGGDAARVIRYMSLFGPKSTTSMGVDLKTMFANKNIGLFVFYGAPTDEAIGEFDNVDASMVTAAQIAAGAGGGTMSAEELAELQDMIAKGELSPEILELLDNLVELAQLQEMALDPDLLPEIESKLNDLKQEISGQIEAAIADGSLPEFLESAVIKTFTDSITNIDLNASIETDLVANNENAAPSDVDAELSPEEQIQALIEQLSELKSIEALDAEIIATLEAQIKNLTDASSLEAAELVAALNDIQSELSDLASSETLPDAVYESLSESLPALAQTVESVASDITPTLLEQLDNLADMGAKELAEIIQQLNNLENRPAEIEALLDQINEQINIAESSPQELAEKLTEAIKAGADTALGALVQNLVVELSSPETQAQLPQATLNNLNSFLDSQSTLVEAIAVQATVQSLESAIEDLDPNNPEAQKAAEAIQQKIDELKAVEQSVTEVDVTTLATALANVDPTVLNIIQPALDKVTSTVESMQSDNVILANDTKEALLEAAKDPDVSQEVRKKIEAAIQNGDDAALIAVMVENPNALPTLPPNIQEAAHVAIDQYQASVNDTSATRLEVSLSPETIAEIENAIAETDQSIDPAIKEQLAEAIKTGDVATIAELVADNPALEKIIPESAVTEVNQAADVIAEVTTSEVEAKTVEGDVPTPELNETTVEANKGDVEVNLETGDTPTANVTPEAPKPDAADAFSKLALVGGTDVDVEVPALESVDRTQTSAPAIPVSTVTNPTESTPKTDSSPTTATEQAAAKREEYAQNINDRIDQGRPVTKAKAEIALQMKDDNINRMTDGPEKDLAIEQRQELAQKLDDVVADMNKDLVEKPGDGLCKPPCPCCDQQFNEVAKELKQAGKDASLDQVAQMINEKQKESGAAITTVTTDDFIANQSALNEGQKQELAERILQEDRAEAGDNGTPKFESVEQVREHMQAYETTTAQDDKMADSLRQSQQQSQSLVDNIMANSFGSLQDGGSIKTGLSPKDDSHVCFPGDGCGDGITLFTTPDGQNLSGGTPARTEALSFENIGSSEGSFERADISEEKVIKNSSLKGLDMLNI